jgi:hypothetical protein
MDMSEDELRAKAIQWVKDNKNALFEELIKDKDYGGMTTAPAASFMAGTPGAGKIEDHLKIIYTREELSVTS